MNCSSAWARKPAMAAYPHVSASLSSSCSTPHSSRNSAHLDGPAVDDTIRSLPTTNVSEGTSTIIYGNSGRSGGDYVEPSGQNENDDNNDEEIDDSILDELLEEENIDFSSGTSFEEDCNSSELASKIIHSATSQPFTEEPVSIALAPTVEVQSRPPSNRPHLRRPLTHPISSRQAIYLQGSTSSSPEPHTIPRRGDDPVASKIAQPPSATAVTIATTRAIACP